MSIVNETCTDCGVRFDHRFAEHLTTCPTMRPKPNAVQDASDREVLRALAEHLLREAKDPIHGGPGSKGEATIEWCAGLVRSYASSDMWADGRGPLLRSIDALRAERGTQR